ncbi:hypothetical protein N658DRAFT_499752 [Parathielavia hyrcaniae]|uniref:Uncharacterized protein n=1 Tax=Parathielavia hyrcaniae TaxID=113614 RepID=A0AAN6PUV2_9PEZI|nr:hypothetical protein N658DRAFT_499752 [Parathielavia hyrcaniae]
MYATRSTALKRTRGLGSESGANGRTEAGKSALQTLLLAINEQQNGTRETIVELRNVVGRQQDVIEQLCEELRQARDEARDVVCKQQTMV